jgi:hypothetical protein
MPVSIFNGRSSVSSGNFSVGPRIVSGPTAILIGYIQASTPPSFIGDCTATFTNVLCTVPLYVSSDGALGNTNVYSLGQLPHHSSYPTAGSPFYTNTGLTTTLANAGGRVYGFNANSNGVPNRQIRISTGTPNDYDGWEKCQLSAYGYYVISSTKVNVGSTNQAFAPTDDSTTPYVGQVLYTSAASAPFPTPPTTIAWALSANVTATHLITFGSSTTVVSAVS